MGKHIKLIVLYFENREQAHRLPHNSFWFENTGIFLLYHVAVNNFPESIDDIVFSFNRDVI